MANWRDELQEASWNGLVFYYESLSEHTGRNLVVHQYIGGLNPFIEDMGRAVQQVEIDAFINDIDWDVWQGLISFRNNAMNFTGIGELVHPTLGTKNATLMGLGTTTNKNRGSMVAIRFTFVIYEEDQTEVDDDTQGMLALSSIEAAATAISDFIATGLGLLATAEQFIADALAPVLALIAAAEAITGDAQRVMSALGGLPTVLAGTNKAVSRYLNSTVSNGVNGVAGSINNTGTGSPANGATSNITNATGVVSGNGAVNTPTQPSAINPFFAGVDMSQSAVPRVAAAVAAAIAGVNKAAQTATNCVGQIQYQMNNIASQPPKTYLNNFGNQVSGTIEYLRVVFNEPPDQIRTLLYVFNSIPVTLQQPSQIGVSIPALVTSITGHLIRMSILCSVANAIMSYQITSSKDAQNYIELLMPYFQAELYVANTLNQAFSVQAINDLKLKMVNDLLVRAAQLPELIQYTAGSSLPGRVLAYRLYLNQYRETELVKRNDVANPIFMPVVVEALSY